MTRYVSSAATNVGRLRKHNEDNWFADNDLGLWLVADGMGGHACGEVASQVTVDVIPRFIRGGEGIDVAIQQAHEAILTAVEIDDTHKGMGTTLVAARAEEDEMVLAWVGDSRIYLHDPEAEPSLTQLSKDHSFVQMLLDIGSISRAEAARHPHRNVITQNLGDGNIRRLNVDKRRVALRPGQRLMLCSDGLSDMVHDREIAAIMEQDGSLDETVAALLEAALRNGGRDNVTVIVIAKEQDD